MTRREFRQWYKDAFPQYGLYVNLVQLAEVLGVAERTAYELVHECAVPFYRPQRRKMYIAEEAFEIIQKTKWAGR